MTNDEIMAELRSDTPLNRARAKFSGWAARLEQEGLQRNPIGPVEVRGLEFQAVKEIGAAFIEAECERCAKFVRAAAKKHRDAMSVMDLGHPDDGSDEEYFLHRVSAEELEDLADLMSPPAPEPEEEPF